MRHKPLIRTNSHLKHDSTVKSKQKIQIQSHNIQVFLNNGSCYLRSHWCKINSKKKSENLIKTHFPWLFHEGDKLCGPIVSNESQMGFDNIIESHAFFVK